MAVRLPAPALVLRAAVQGRGGLVAGEDLLPTRTTRLRHIPSILQGRHRVPQEVVG